MNIQEIIKAIELHKDTDGDQSIQMCWERWLEIKQIFLSLDNNYQGMLLWEDSNQTKVKNIKPRLRKNKAHEQKESDRDGI